MPSPLTQPKALLGHFKLGELRAKAVQTNELMLGFVVTEARVTRLLGTHHIGSFPAATYLRSAAAIMI